MVKGVNTFKKLFASWKWKEESFMIKGVNTLPATCGRFSKAAERSRSPAFIPSNKRSFLQ